MKRITALALALVSVLLLVRPAWAAQAGEDKETSIAAIHTRSNGQPYYIMVNRAQNTVTVYGLDEDNYYTVPVKAMICSVGREGHATPTGTFSIGGKWPWVHMLDSSYGQYVSQISGNILFHSVCYTKRDPSTLMTFEYNALGERASLGCVRLQSGDAKWIYDNCGRGTKVTIYDSEDPGPLGKPPRTVDFITEAMDNGWDPTDPREGNPWRTGPAPAADQAVSYAHMAEVLCELSGASSSDALAWAEENSILPTGSNSKELVTRQEMVAMLYRYETAYLKRTVRVNGSLTRFTDAPAVWTYNQDSMRWAVGTGLMNGTSGTTLSPNNYATKVQLNTVLQRYQNLTR